MKACFILVIALCEFGGTGFAGEFYQQFLWLVNTNERPQRPIRHPSLVDTNNTGPKATSAALNLDTLRQSGEVSGVQLGMSMDEAVGRWGKPTTAWSPGCLHGLTTLFYKDVGLGFEGDCLETIRITPVPKLAGGLWPDSSINEFVRVLGPPTARRSVGDAYMLYYLSPKVSLVLDFHQKRLVNVWLERTPSRAEPWKETVETNPQGAVASYQPVWTSVASGDGGLLDLSAKPTAADMERAAVYFGRKTNISESPILVVFERLLSRLHQPPIQVLRTNAAIQEYRLSFLPSRKGPTVLHWRGDARRPTLRVYNWRAGNSREPPMVTTVGEPYSKWDTLTEKLNKIRFWEKPCCAEWWGVKDGFFMVMEVLDRGRYHIVVRAAGEDEEFEAMCWRLLDSAPELPTQ
jgi:hypothetical protein